MIDDPKVRADFRGIIGAKVEWDEGYWSDIDGKSTRFNIPKRGIVRGGYGCERGIVHLLVEMIEDPPVADIDHRTLQTIEIGRWPRIKVIHEEKEMPGEGYRREGSTQTQ